MKLVHFERIKTVRRLAHESMARLVSYSKMKSVTDEHIARFARRIRVDFWLIPGWLTAGIALTSALSSAWWLMLGVSMAALSLFDCTLARRGQAFWLQCRNEEQEAVKCEWAHLAMLLESLEIMDASGLTGIVEYEVRDAFDA